MNFLASYFCINLHQNISIYFPISRPYEHLIDYVYLLFHVLVFQRVAQTQRKDKM